MSLCTLLPLTLLCHCVPYPHYDVIPLYFTLLCHCVSHQTHTTLHYTYPTLTNTRCTTQDTTQAYVHCIFLYITYSYIYTYDTTYSIIVCYTCYHLLQMRNIIKKGCLLQARCCIINQALFGIYYFSKYNYCRYTCLFHCTLL